MNCRCLFYSSSSEEWTMGFFPVERQTQRQTQPFLALWLRALLLQPGGGRRVDQDAVMTASSSYCLAARRSSSACAVSKDASYAGAGSPKTTWSGGRYSSPPASLRYARRLAYTSSNSASSCASFNSCPRQTAAGSAAVGSMSEFAVERLE